MGSFTAQPNGMMQLLQMLMSQMQNVQQMKPPPQSPGNPQAFGQGMTQMPQPNQMFQPPKLPHFATMMQPAATFAAQPAPEMKAITAMKPPANPWLKNKGKL